MNVNDVKKILVQHADNSRQLSMEAYMRHQFPFLVIQATERRQLTRDFVSQFKPKDAIDWTTIESLWHEKEREYKYIALDILRRQKKQLTVADVQQLRKLALYESWWDTIDGLDVLIGHIDLHNHHQIVPMMLEWSEEESIWLRRISIDYQRLHRHCTDEIVLATVIENNLGQTEFFINKAIGWSLREYSKTNEAFVRHFIQTHSLNPLSEREALKWLNK